MVDIRRPPRVAAARRACADQLGEPVNELKELCRTAGVRVLDVLEQRRPEVDPKFLIGRGKLDEVLIRAMQLDAEVLIFDRDLTPVQARAIADVTDLKVLDRTQLILDIFAQRAKSRDGKLQVELAQLTLPAAAPAEKNTMMWRLTGGIGGRGPGETKLERTAGARASASTASRRRSTGFGEQRAGRRAERVRRGLPIVAIVGYTNAGKSTLLNTLTAATCSPRTSCSRRSIRRRRRLRFPREREVIITDTVGFIRDLPKDLARAFRATLEELDDADLLLHVVDAADPAREQHIAAVEAILADLGLAETRRILVWNKIDLLPPSRSRAGAPRASGRRSPGGGDVREGRRDDGVAAGGGRGGAGQPGVRGRRGAAIPTTRVDIARLRA